MISGREFMGKVEVAAPNVTIRNSRFRDDGWWQVHSQSTGLVIEDSEFIGTVPCHNSIGYGNYTVRRSEITGCEHGADVGEDNVTLTDNWIHDLETEVTHPYSPFSTPHTDGVLGIGNNVLVRHNTIDPCPTARAAHVGDHHGHPESDQQLPDRGQLHRRRGAS